MAAGFRQDSFTHVLVGDVVSATERVQGNENQTYRRELVRTVFSAIEGLHWKLKRDVFLHAQVVADLTPHEEAALLEETYSVDDRGNVRAQPKFMPLLSAIRLVISIVKRYRPAYEVDFNHVGWTNLCRAVELRNRIVHPKTLEDLSVSDKEIEQSLSAFYWLLALCIEVLRETKEHLYEFQRVLKKPSESGANDT